MDPIRDSPPVPLGSGSGRRKTAEAGSRRRRRHRSRAGGPRGERVCDFWSGAIILFLAVFTPWALGTTQTWSIWVANGFACALGLLLAAKWTLRARSGQRPPRWGEPVVISENSGEIQTGSTGAGFLTRFLAVVTVAVLAFVLVGALNGRADWNEVRREFSYSDWSVGWLPHSYDSGASWFAFWQYLGLACVFWAARDWLLHRGPRDRDEDDSARWEDPHGAVVVPRRLQLLLWTLCLNGVLLAVVGILQRAQGTNRLLWLVESQSGKGADRVFGPWSYRSSAAQYFNLLWPVCIAFWIWMQERVRRAVDRGRARLDGPQIVLLPCGVLLAACPIITASRAGAGIGILAGALAVLAILRVSRRQTSQGVRWLTVLTMSVAFFAGLVGGWSHVSARLLRADRTLPTGIEVGGGDATLLVRFRPTVPAADSWPQIVALSGDDGAEAPAGAVRVFLSPGGGLNVHLTGSARTNYLRYFVPGFGPAFEGRETLLAIVRQDGWRIYADGRELAASASGSGEAPQWRDPLATRYLHSLDVSVSEAALVNVALSPEELAAAGTAPLTGLADSVVTAKPFASGNTAGTAGLSYPDGVSGHFTTRPSDPAVPWLVVRREQGTGTLAFRRKLDSADPRLRGPLRAVCDAWNPGNDPIRLGVTVDGGPAALVEIPPRSDQRLELPCRPPHNRAPAHVDVFLADEVGSLDTDVAPDRQFALRNLELRPDARVFARAMNQGFQTLDFSDRLSGRSEIYHNARQMAADHPWWGSGAGTFATLYQLYRQPGQTWAAYAHNDWLEMRITLGRIGTALVTAALLALFVRSCLGRGLAVPHIVLVLWWLALGTCLLHAVFDLPFQVYSVFLLFVLLASALLVLTGTRRN